MLYYPTEIRHYDSSSAELADSRMEVYEILRAYMDRSVIDQVWRLTFHLAAEDKGSKRFIIEPNVYNGHGNNNGLLKLMGIELPEGLENSIAGIIRLPELEGRIMGVVTQKDGLRALYPALNSGESRVI